MTLPPGAQRKINQLDNDIGAIYGMLTQLEITQKRQAIRLDEIATRQDDHGRILGDHTAKHDSHTAKHDSHTAKLDEILTLLRERK